MAWTWILGFLFAGIMIWIGFSRQVSSMRPSTRQLFALVGFLVLLMMIALSLDRAFEWWAKFPKEVVGVIGILIVVDRLVRITMTRWKAGAVTLDLGRVPGLEMLINIFTAVALGWYVLKNLMEIVKLSDWKFADISYEVFGLSIAIAVLIQGVSKRGLFERGVFHGTGLLPWEKIGSFGWEKESTTSATLVLYKRTKTPLFGSANLSVRSEHMKPIEDILEQHNITRRGDAPKLEP